jgi:hypothetical protein
LVEKTLSVKDFVRYAEEAFSKQDAPMHEE